MTRDDLVKQKQSAANFLKNLVTPDIGGIKMQHDAFVELMKCENAIHTWDEAYEAGAKAEREAFDKERDELKAANSELLVALEWIAGVETMGYEYQAKARAAIAKARGAE